MRDEDPRDLDEERGFRMARVNPVGILEVPAGPAGEPEPDEAPEEGGGRRRVPGRVRFAALVLLALFAFVTVATTVASLGAYCLTTDGGDLRELPAAPAR